MWAFHADSQSHMLLIYSIFSSSERCVGCYGGYGSTHLLQLPPWHSCDYYRAISAGSSGRGGQDTAAAGQWGGVGAALRQGLVQVHQRAAVMGGEASQYG